MIICKNLTDINAVQDDVIRNAMLEEYANSIQETIREHDLEMKDVAVFVAPEFYYEMFIENEDAYLSADNGYIYWTRHHFDEFEDPLWEYVEEVQDGKVYQVLGLVNDEFGVVFFISKAIVEGLKVEKELKKHLSELR